MKRCSPLLVVGGIEIKKKDPSWQRWQRPYSDKVIFTSDNPREEDPEEIIDQMEAGVAPEDYKKTLRITQRKAAIKAACMELI